MARRNSLPPSQEDSVPKGTLRSVDRRSVDPNLNGAFPGGLPSAAALRDIQNLGTLLRKDFAILELPVDEA